VSRDLARLTFRRIATLALILSAIAAVLGGGPVACGTSGTSETFAPITGIVVRAESLTTGRGCGTEGSQIFKYVAAVFGLNPADVMQPPAKQRYDLFLAANVYDCFTDGLFVNLPDTFGVSSYDVQVFAFNKAAYDAAGGDAALKSLTAQLQAERAALVAALADPDSGNAALDSVNAINVNITRLRAVVPTYSTVCTATQYQLVQTLAVCPPLSAGATAIGKPTPPATVTLSTATFAGPEGGTLRCGPGLDYVRVRYRTGTGNTFGPITESDCNLPTDGGTAPFVITVSPAPAPASITIEVALLRGDGTVVGQTTCGAETSPGLTTAAVCKPIQ
jgi:hypothetical protein